MGFSPEFFLQVLIAIGGIFGAYAVVRERLAHLETKIDSHIKMDDDRHATIESRLEGSYQSIHDVRDDVITLVGKVGRLEGRKDVSGG